MGHGLLRGEHESAALRRRALKRFRDQLDPAGRKGRHDHVQASWTSRPGGHRSSRYRSTSSIPWPDRDRRHRKAGSACRARVCAASPSPACCVTGSGRRSSRRRRAGDRGLRPADMFAAQFARSAARSSTAINRSMASRTRGRTRGRSWRSPRPPRPALQPLYGSERAGGLNTAARSLWASLPRLFLRLCEFDVSAVRGDVSLLDLAVRLREWRKRAPLAAPRSMLQFNRIAACTESRDLSRALTREKREPRSRN